MIRKGLTLALPPLAATLGFGTWGYFGAAPGAPVPDNWGLNAKPEVIGDKVEAFVALPVLALAITIVLAVAPLIDARGNLRRSEQAYVTHWAGMLFFIMLIQGGITLRALELWRGDNYGPMLPLWAAGLSMLVVALGNVLGKARPNWFIGIRTPWTLASEWTWDRTHRFAGRLFVAVGILCLAIAVARSANEAMIGLTFGIVAAALVSALHSYLMWRRAPDRPPLKR